MVTYNKVEKNKNYVVLVVMVPICFEPDAYDQTISNIF